MSENIDSLWIQIADMEARNVKIKQRMSAVETKKKYREVLEQQLLQFLLIKKEYKNHLRQFRYKDWRKIEGDIEDIKKEKEYQKQKEEYNKKLEALEAEIGCKNREMLQKEAEKIERILMEREELGSCMVENM